MGAVSNAAKWAAVPVGVGHYLSSLPGVYAVLDREGTVVPVVWATLGEQADPCAEAGSAAE
jgi:hypothetical protein